MSAFDKAYEKVAIIEGGWAHHKADPGGATNFGISLRFLKGLDQDDDGDGWLDGDLDHDGDIDIEDVRSLGPDQAKEIYFDRFWTRYKYPLIRNQALADKVFSFSVHMGPGRAHRLLQTAIAYHGDITIDGILGNQSLSLANSIDANRILVELQHEAAKFYRDLVANKSQLGEFINGWLNRAYE